MYKKIIDKLKQLVPNSDELTSDEVELTDDELEKWLQKTVELISKKIRNAKNGHLSFNYLNQNTRNVPRDQKLLDKHYKIIEEIFSENFNVIVLQTKYTGHKTIFINRR